MQKIVIAIDGTAGSGKTTTCIKLAYLLDYIPVLTGKLYRGISAYLLNKNIEINKIKNILSDLKINYYFENGKPKVLINETDVTPYLEDPEVEKLTSRIAELQEVRNFLFKVQREFVNKKGVVMEGRDIGTVIAPDADIKIFMDADIKIRTERRYKDFLKKGKNISFEEVLKELEERDKRDREREIAPLKKSKDAYFIDTTNKSIDEQVFEILKIVYKKIYKNKEKMRWKIAYFIAYPIFKWLFGMRITGRENVIRKGPCIFASNHVTFWDPPFVGFAVKRESFFLAKIDLFIQNALFAWLIKKFNAIPLRRGAGAVSAYEKAEELLQEGKAVIIFPEGTRSRKGVLLPFKKGAASLACKMKVPIYPIYIKNVLAGPGKWILRRKRLEIKIGKPLLPEKNTKEYVEIFNKKLEEEVKKLSLT